MNIKNIFCFIFTLFLLSFTAKADVFRRQDVSTITIHYIWGNDIESSLVIKITADSITIPQGFCNDKECSRDGPEIEYLGHHDIFKFVPEQYLSGSNYISPITYDDLSTTKLEICIVDGRCHSWNYEGSDDKEMILFHNKLNEIISSKSEYQFH
ncbi:putative zinc-finger domain protein, partial [Gilliamella apicola SCGC AB-598-B02]